MRVFQASQQWPKMSSMKWNTLLDNQFWRMNCQMFFVRSARAIAAAAAAAGCWQAPADPRTMPYRLIEDHDGMGAGRDLAGDHVEMQQLHDLAVWWCRQRPLPLPR